MKTRLDPKLKDAFGKYKTGMAALRANDVASAIKLLREAGDAGFAPAFFQLGYEARSERNMDEVRRCLESIEKLAASGDPFALVAAYHAYQSGFSGHDWRERQRIANEYLRRGAELGDSVAQWLLAENYLGANGLPRDLPSYEYWIQRAIEGGEDEAVCSFAQYHLDQKRALPPSLKQKVARLADQFPGAAKLLARADRFEERQSAKRQAAKLRNTKSKDTR